MKKHNVRHYLEIYQLRKQMQEKGITHPSEEIQRFTKELVMKLSSLPMDEDVTIESNSFFDSNGNLIITFPTSEEDLRL